MAEVRTMPEIQYRAQVPDPVAFVGLFETTGWDPQGRLTVAAAAEALGHTWYAASAYDGARLVGTGRIIGDGVLHASSLTSSSIRPTDTGASEAPSSSASWPSAGRIASSTRNCSARAATRGPSTSGSASPSGPRMLPAWNW